MTVRDVMRQCPRCCGESTNLAAVTEMLWQSACGALPVVDAGGVIVGILTDRDICVATGTSDHRPSELTAGHAMSRQLATCMPDEEIHDALRVMRARRVRRLPVIDAAGKLEGMLCLSDLIARARHDDGTRPELSYENVMGVLKAIYCGHATCTMAETAYR